MTTTDIINTIVSALTAIIAVVSIFLTSHQIKRTNKQSLFDRRLSSFLKFKQYYSLYIEYKKYLEEDDTFSSTIDLVFSWLTNCSDLEEMCLAMNKPLSGPEQKLFLTKIEQLRNLSAEISMIFDNPKAKIASEFVSEYSDLLQGMYRQQVYVTDSKKSGTKDLNSARKDYKEMAAPLYKTRNCLKITSQQIENQRIIEKFEKEIKLTRNHFFSK